jgi:hypothetical protein
MTPRSKIIKKLLEKDEPITYSGCMRAINKLHPELIEPFMKAFKNSFLKATKQSLDDPEAIALLEAFQTMSVTAQYGIQLMKIADMKNPIGTGKSMAAIIKYMLDSIPQEQRSKYVVSIKTKLSQINDIEIANTNMPDGAIIGQVLTFVKTVLHGNDPLYIRGVLKNIGDSI